jgi:hypothetical protein
LTEQVAPAALPAPLFHSLSRTAAALAAGAAAAEALSPAVLTVVEGVLKTMALSKLKLGLALVLTVALLGGGLVFMAHAAATGTERAAPPPPAADRVAQTAGSEPDARAKADQPPADAKSKVEALWADLLTNNEAKVVRTVLGLAATPRDTVAFLKEHLRPVKAEPRRVAALIADLDSSAFTVRRKAEEQLEYLEKYVRQPLRRALADKPSLDVSKRIDALLQRLPDEPLDEAEDLPSKLKKELTELEKIRAEYYAALRQLPHAPLAPTGPSPLWLRAKRAIMVLEHIATPEARALLTALAEGEPEALPTKEAKAALQRLANPDAKIDSEAEPVPAKEAPKPAGLGPYYAPAIMR